MKIKDRVKFRVRVRVRSRVKIRVRIRVRIRARVEVRVRVRVRVSVSYIYDNMEVGRIFQVRQISHDTGLARIRLYRCLIPTLSWFTTLIFDVV